MPTATKQPGDEDLNVAQNLQNRETDFSSQVSSSQGRGTSDVADDIDAAGGNVGGYIKKGTHVDQHGDTVQNNYNADDPSANIDDAKEREEAGDSSANTPFIYNNGDSRQGGMRGFAGNLRGKGKNLAASGSILTLLLLSIAGVGGITTTIGSSILINIKEIFQNDRADGARANEIFSQATIAHKIDYKGADCGRVAIKCRMGTMSDKELKKYEAAGFKLQGDIIGTDGKKIGDYSSPEENTPTTDKTTSAKTANDRYIIRKVTFSDGHSVSSGSGFFAWTAANVKMRVASVGAFNPRSAFFLNEKFNDILEKAFGFNKGKTLTGATDDEINKNFDEETHGTTQAEEEAGVQTVTEAKEKSIGDKIKSAASSSANVALNTFTAACTAYNAAETAVTGVKMVRLYQLVSFALPWFQAADQIKTQGSISPELVNNLSSRLTSYKTTGPEAGLTATDSQGYQIAAYGDQSKLADFAKTWMLGGDPTGTAAHIDSVLTTITSLKGSIDSKTGKKTVRYICKGLSNVGATAVGLGLLLASCVSSFFGNEATGPASCALPLAWTLVGFAAQQAISSLADQISQYAINEAKNFHLGSDLDGVDAGNAIAAGAGLMLGGTSTASGLQPARNVSDIQNYISYTDNINNQYIAAEQYNTRNTPFDITNQYSFLGSIISRIKPIGEGQAPLFGALANLTSIVSTAFTGNSTTANALYSQPSFSQSSRYQQCDDTDLQSIGVVPDDFCDIATFMPTTDLQAAQAQVNGTDTIDQIIDYMMKPQNASEKDGGTLDDSACGDGSPSTIVCNPAKNLPKPWQDQTPQSAKPSIDNTGKPIPGSQYARYLEYCTDARLTPASQKTWDGESGSEAYWGTTIKSIEDGSNRDQDWYSGKQCTDPIHSKMMEMFRDYTNYCLQVATMDGTDNCWDTTTASNAALINSTAGVCGLVNNPNITYVNPKTKEDLAKNCAGQTVTNVCGDQMMIDPQLANTLNTLSSKYKIYVNNFGFADDRTTCDQGQHPKGKAVDLNGIQEIGGAGAGGTNWGDINYNDPNQLKVVNQYASDFIATLPSNEGGVGQKQCGVNPSFAGQTNVNGAALFEDSCNHLHIDVRTR